MSSSSQHDERDAHAGYPEPQPHFLKSLRRDGYVVVQNLISPEQLARLRQVSSHITALARNNKWPHIRTVPKQYPPWPANTQGANIWGIQHLLHPDMPGRRVFAELYFSDAVLDIVKELVGTHDDAQGGDVKAGSKQPNGGSTKTIRDDTANNNQHDARSKNKSTNTFSNGSNDSNGDISSLNGGANGDMSSSRSNNIKDDMLVMELFNLLVSPGSGTDFELCWHRDDIKPTVTPSEELSQLQAKSPQTGPQLHAQYNIALYPDASLIVVPGSHARIRTATERNAPPYEANMPGSITVPLAPGDGVFYDSNILHRGVYAGIDETQDTGRMTLHGSVGLAGHGGQRARQVLQHAVGEWVHLDKEIGFGLEGRTGSRAEAMRNRLIALGRGEDIGYSLEG